MADQTKVEERIVAAKFDSSDFEKGVDKTIKKLDELKENLDFKKTGKSIEELGKKTKEATDSINSNVEKLSDRLTTFTGMLKQKFLGGLADQVVGVFFKMENAVKSFMHSMTFDQISAGMQKYEDALTSVRMITNSFYKDANGKMVRYTQDQAYESIRALQQYADETSYSMTQMTDAMSKMVSAGVGLKQAEKNVQGIANACAAAGVNATEAQRAFFNLSQAYSSGSLKYTDYRSLQLLNMTNENFENQLLAAAEAAGTLKKVRDGVWKTAKSSTNKKVTAGKQVTRKNLAEALKYGFADTDVMDILFGQNFYVDIEDYYKARDKYEDDEDRVKYLTSLTDLDKLGKYIDSLADTDERKKKYKELNSDDERKQYLENLAKEADELNSIAKKYDAIDLNELENYIKGLDDKDKRKQRYKSLKNDKERQEYLKTLANDADVLKNVERKYSGIDEKAIENYINALADTDERKIKYNSLKTDRERKEYLKQLASEAESVSNVGKKYGEVAARALVAAREARNFTDVLNAVKDYISSRWTKVFEALIGELDEAAKFFTKLSETGIAGFFYDLSDWIADSFGAFNEGGIGGQQFRETVLEINNAIGDLLSLVFQFLPSSEEMGDRLFEIVASVHMAAEEFRIWIYNLKVWLGEVVKVDEATGKGLTRADRIRSVITNITSVFSVVTKVAALGIKTITKTFELLAPILDGVVEGLNRLTEPFKDLGDTDAGAGKRTIDALTNSINNMFTVIEPIVKSLSPIISDFIGILGDIGAFFVSMSIDTVIMNIEFFADAIGMILELFGVESSQKLKDGKGVLGGIAEEVENIKLACSQALGAVKEFFTTLLGDLRRILGLSHEGETSGEEGGIFSGILNFFETNEFIKTAQEWLAQAKIDVENWFNKAIVDVRDWFASIPERITKLVTGLFYEEVTKVETNDAGETRETTEIVTTPLYNWLIGVKDSVTNWFTQAIEDIKTWFGSLPEKVTDFVTGLFYTKKKVHGNRHKRLYGEYEYVETPLKIWLDGVVETVTKFIAEIPNYIAKGVNTVIDVFGMIIDTVFGTGEDKKDQNGEKTATDAVQQWATAFVESLRTMLTSLPQKVKDLFAKVKEKFKKAFESIKTWFNTNETVKAIVAWGASLIEQIKNFILNIPKYIKDIIKGIGSFGRTIISTIKEIISGKEVGEAAKTEIEEGLEEGIKDISLGGILSSIADIGTTIINEFLSWFTGTTNIEENFKWFSDTVLGFITSIPDKIWKGIENFGQDMTDVWNYIVAQLKPVEERTWSEAKTVADFEKDHPVLASMVNNTITWVSEIPGRLETTITDVAQHINRFWNGLSSLFAKNSRIAEIKKQLKSDNLSIEEIQSLSSELINLQRKPSNFEKENPFISSIITSIQNWFMDLPGMLGAAWDSTKKEATEFWNDFLTFWNDPTLGINGAEEGTEHAATAFEEKHPMLAGWVISAREWIQGIPTTLKSAWDSAVKDISAFFDEFYKYWEALGKENQNGEKSTANALTEQESNTIKSFEEAHPVIANAVKTIQSWLSNLDDTIKTAWTAVTQSLTEFWNKLVAAFNGEKVDDVPDGEESFGAKLANKIVEVIANLPTWIANGIDEAIKAISSAIGTVTDWINNALKTDDPMGAIEESFEENAEKTADEMKDSPKNAFVESLKNIGQSILSLFTVTIPEFITSGFEWLKTNWITNWKPSLATLFENVTGVEFNYESIKNAIIDGFKNLPKTISEAWNDTVAAISRLINSGKKQLGYDQILQIQRAPSEEARKAIVDSFEKAGYNVSEFKKKSSIWDTINNIKKAIEDVINEVFNSPFVIDAGKFVLNLWNGVIGGIQKFFTLLTSWFDKGIKKDGSDEMNAEGLGEAVQETYGVSIVSELGASLNELGTNIFSLFTKTIPEFLGKAIGTVVLEVPNLINTFMTGLSSVLSGGVSDGIPEVVEDVTESAQEAADESVKKTVNPLKIGQEIIDKMLSDPDYRDWLLSSPEKREYINYQRIRQGLEKYVVGDIDNMHIMLRGIYDDLLDNDEYYEYFRSRAANDSNMDENQKQIEDAFYQNFYTTYDGYLKLFENMDEYTEEIEKKAEELEKKSDSEGDNAKKATNAAQRGVTTFQSGLEMILGMFVNIDKETGEVKGLNTMANVALWGLLIDTVLGFVERFKDLFHWTDSETQKAKNSITGVMRVAMEALIVGAVFATVASQFNEQQFDQAMTAFDKIASLITTIVGITGGASIIGDIADLIGAFSGAPDAGTVVKLGAGFGLATAITAITNVLDDIGGVLETLGNGIKTMASELAASIGDITAILPLLDDFNKVFDTMLEVMKKGLNMTNSVYLGGDMSDAIEAMNNFLAPLTAFAELTKGNDIHAKEVIDSIIELINMTGKMTEFVKFTEDGNTFERFKYAISSLGSALSFYELGSKVDATEFNESGIKNAVDFLKAILGDEELPGLVEKLKPSFFSGDALEMQSATEMLVIFAGGLAKLGAAAAGIDDQTAENINRFITESTAITVPRIGSGSDDSDITGFAAAMINLGSGISSLMSAAGEIGDAGGNFDKIQSVLGYLAHLANVVKGFENSDFAQIFIQKGDLQSFGQTIDLLGGHISEFVRKISQSVLVTTTDKGQLDNIKDAVDYAVGIVTRLADSVANIRFPTNGLDHIQLLTFAGQIVDFIAGMGSLETKFSEINDGKILDDAAMKRISETVDIFKNVVDVLYPIWLVIDKQEQLGKIMNSLVGNFDPNNKDLSVISGLIQSIKMIAKNITDDDMSTMNRVGPMLNLFMQALAEIITALSSGNAFEFSIDPMQQIVTYLTDNFDALSKLFDLADTLDLEKLDKATRLFGALKELGSAIRMYYDSDELSGGNRFYSAVAALESLDMNELRDAIGHFIQGYSEILDDPQNDSRLNEIGISMAEKIRNGIKTALESDSSENIIQVRLTPVIDYNDEEARRNMASLFGMEATTDFNLGTGIASSIRSAFIDSETEENIIDYRSELGQINESLDFLKSDLQYVGRSIQSLKLYLDSGVLIGEIAPGVDAYMAEQADIWGRHVSGTGGRTYLNT